MCCTSPVAPVPAPSDDAIVWKMHPVARLTAQQVSLSAASVCNTF